jgi:hypothetical protein
MLKLAAASLFLLATTAGLVVTALPDRADPPAVAFQQPQPQPQQVGGPRVQFFDGRVIPMAPQGGGPVTRYAGAAGGWTADLVIIEPGLIPGWPTGFWHTRLIAPQGRAEFAGPLGARPFVSYGGGIYYRESSFEGWKYSQFGFFEN